MWWLGKWENLRLNMQQWVGSPSQKMSSGTCMFKGAPQLCVCPQKEHLWKIFCYNQWKPISSPYASHVAFETKAWVTYGKFLVHKNHVVLSLNLMRVKSKIPWNQADETLVQLFWQWQTIQALHFLLYDASVTSSMKMPSYYVHWVYIILYIF